MKNRISRIIDNDLESKKDELIFSLIKAGLVICSVGVLSCLGLLLYLRN